MSALDSWHPDSKDLANLAKERLSQKEAQYILDHCKECRECADKLLETIRSGCEQRRSLFFSPPQF